MDFTDFAPFTCVVLDWSSVSFGIEIVWDGKLLQKQILDDTPRIWSSSSLYADSVRKEVWFETWL